MPSSRPRPLATTRSASAIWATCAEDAWKSCGSAPSGINTVTRESSPTAQVAISLTTLPRMVVVTTTLGAKSFSAESVSTEPAWIISPPAALHPATVSIAASEAIAPHWRPFLVSFMPGSITLIDNDCQNQSSRRAGSSITLATSATKRDATSPSTTR